MANFEQQNFQIFKTFNGKFDAGDGWALAGANGKVSWATFELKVPVGYANGSRLRFKMHQKYDGLHQIGCFRISLTNFEKPIGLGLSEELLTKLAQPADQRPEEVKTQLAQSFEKSDVKLADLKKTLAEAKKKVPVDKKIVGLRQKLERVKKPVPEDVQLTQFNNDIKQSEVQLANERLTAAQDLTWALINSPSFLFNR